MITSDNILYFILQKKLFHLIITSNYQGEASFEAFEAFVAPMLSWSLKSGDTDYFWIKILSTNLKTKPVLKFQINILLNMGLRHSTTSFFVEQLCTWTGEYFHLWWKNQCFERLRDFFNNIFNLYADIYLRSYSLLGKLKFSCRTMA